MDIKTVAVAGAGTMGNGIAHVLAQHGFTVILLDQSDEDLNRGLETIKKNLGRQVRKEKISEDDAAATVARIS